MPASGERRHGCLGVACLAIGALYLVFPTGGFIELLPDYLPFVGSLDEAGATGLLLFGLRLLGIDPLGFSDLRAKRREPPRG